MASIETTTFRSEFMVMNQAPACVQVLRYKLRIFGIPVDVPVFVFGDNQSALCNTSIPESTLKKKALSIAYHFVCEGCVVDRWRISYIQTSLNLDDLMTTHLLGGTR